MSDPTAPTRMSVTIKVPESARYAADNPWLVFEGTGPAVIRQMIIDTFELADTDGKDLYAIVLDAQTMVTGAANIARGLKGVSVGRKADSPGTADTWEKAREGAEGDGPPWKSEEKKTVDPITAALEGAASIPDLQQIWAENQAVFTPESEYMALYKKRGRELKGA